MPKFFFGGVEPEQFSIVEKKQAMDPSNKASRLPVLTSVESKAKHTRGQHGSSPEEAQLTEDIKDYDWDQLQRKYTRMMGNHGKDEEDLRAHAKNLLEIFTDWSQTTVDHDEIRAMKRFRTQMHHVQNSEENLEKKRNHYVDVVKAFESALALLNDRVKP